MFEECSRRAAAIATPPRRFYKRKIQEEEPDLHLAVLGVSPLSPKIDRFQDELAALRVMDRREKLARAVERKERRARHESIAHMERLARRTREPEDEEEDLPLYEEVMGHGEQGCHHDLDDRPHHHDESSDSEEEGATSGPTNQVNVILCQH